MDSAETIQRERFGRGERGDALIRPNTSTSLSFVNCFSLFLNALIGLAAFENGQTYRCGIILGTVLNFVFAFLAFYSCWILLTCMRLKKSTSYETCWIESGFKFFPIIAIGTFIPCIGFLSKYIFTIKDLFSTFMHQIWANPLPIILDPYFISLVLMATIYAPMYFRQDLNFIAIISVFGNIIMIAQLCIQYYWTYTYSDLYGFDPNNQFSLFNLSNNFFGAISNNVSCYLSYPFMFLVFSQLYNLNYKRGNKLLHTTIGTFSVFNLLMGIGGYLTLFNREEGNILDYLNPKMLTVRISYIICICKIICVIPPTLEPVRYSLLSIIDIQKEYPTFIWAATALLVFLIAVMLSTLTNNYINIMTCIFNAYVMMMQFVFPGLILIRCMPALPKYHWAMVVIFLVLGFAFTIYSIIGIADYV